MRFAGMGLALVLMATPAVAAEPCLFGHAIYGQAASAFTLEFSPVAGVEGAAANMTNRFAVKAPSVSDEIEGEVYWPNGVGGDETTMSLAGCAPQVDVPEAENACLVWQGKMYALGDKSASSMPAEDEPAPDTILVAGFGWASYYTVNQTGERQVADDVFTLKGCAP